ncbi:MAG: NAD(P)/FAD-dependent oxidoreductase, partial [Myxococcota bacterium]
MPDEEPDYRRCLIIGAGPAGLTAAYEFSKLGVAATVFEKDDIVGGIARTSSYRGNRFDIGGHRFFTKVDAVQEVWEEILESDLLVRRRISRIYYRDRFFDYPLVIGNALFGLGLIEAIRIALSFARAQVAPTRPERTFEEWVTNRFGRRLFQIFFETYTEKVWGVPCSEIGADWAAQRIKNLDLLAAVKNALLAGRKVDGEVISSLIEQFHYPRLGPGMMWERCRDLIAERGISTHLNTDVVRISHREGRATSVTVRDAEGAEREVHGSDFISSMPLRELVRALDPPAPPDVRAAAERLRYRDFLTVVLIVDQPDLFPDQWIYVHSPDVLVGRIQNFKNWSPEMVADPAKTALGLEYFLWDTDELWSFADEELVELGRREAARIGLVEASDVIDGCVVRMPKAYPIYDRDYRDAVATIRSYLSGLSNLESVGRNGQHRYNNQDHSMLTAMYAARNVTGASYDCWDVNVEEDYHEQVKSQDRAGGDRLVPQPVSSA